MNKHKEDKTEKHEEDKTEKHEENKTGEEEHIISDYERIADVIAELVQVVEQHDNDYELICGNHDTSCYDLIIQATLEACAFFKYGDPIEKVSDTSINHQKVKDLVVELYVRFCETEDTVANDLSGIGGCIKELLELIQNYDLNSLTPEEDIKLVRSHFRDLHEKLRGLEDHFMLKRIHTLPRKRKEILSSLSSTTKISTEVSSFDSITKKQEKGSLSWITVCNSSANEVYVDLQHNLAVYHTVNCMDFSSDGKLLAIGEYGTGIRIYNVGIGKELRWARYFPIYSVCFSPDSKYIATTSSNALMVLNIATRQKVLEINSPSYSVKYSIDNKLFFGTNSGVDVWDMEKGECITQLGSDEGCMKTVAVRPGGQLVAAIGWRENNVVKLWDSHYGSFIRQYKGHKKAITGLTFSCDGKLLASGSEDRYIKLWDPSSTMCISTISAKCEVKSIAISPNVRFIAAGTLKRVFFWDLRATHVPYAMLECCTSFVNCVNFSHKEGLLATGCLGYHDSKYTACLWKGFW